MKKTRLGDLDNSILALLIFALITGLGLGARPVETLTTRSVHLILFVPIDTDLPVSESAAIVNGWATDINGWFRREVGKEVIVNFQVIYSTRSRAQLSDAGYTDPCGDVGGPNAQLLVRNELTQYGIPDTGVERVWIVLLGGGGWAGGSYYGQGQADYGWSMIGDWGLRYLITGQHSPCDSVQATSNLGWAFGHEILHSMDVDSHNPVVGLGDVLTTVQRRDLKNNNKVFLVGP